MFEKQDDNLNIDLYIAGFNKGAEKVCENVELVYMTTDDQVFYKSKSGTVSLYDYVIDDQSNGSIYLRQALQAKENDYPIFDLYQFSDGRQTLISENVLNVQCFYNAVMYNTVDMVTGTLDLQNINDLSDVRNLFEIDYSNENFLIKAGATSHIKMSSKAAKTFEEANNHGYTNLYISDSLVFMHVNDGSLSVSSIEEGLVSDFEIITDDSSVLKVDGNSVYYFSDSYTKNYFKYCNLYLYKDGQSDLLAQDVISNEGIQAFEDNVVLAYTNQKDYGGFELSMFEANGKKTVISDGVKQFVRVNKNTVLYISDGDLYSFNGKEKTLIKYDVDWIWCKKYMESIIPQIEKGR